MVPVLLQGIARDDLQRAAPGAPVPWAALRAHLAGGEALWERLPGTAPHPTHQAPPAESSGQDLVDAFADQRTRLCGWLDQQVAARGSAVWDEALPGSGGSGGSGGRGGSVRQACAALVVADRVLLVQLAAHRNWLKGR